MRKVLSFFLIGVFLFQAAAVFAMTSTNYEIGWDSVNFGGEETSTSTNYSLRDTLGELGTGLSESENYQISAGYRAGDGDDSFLSLVVVTQQNSTKIVWTAFSNASKTVTVASTLGFSTSSYIGIVENLGLTQLVAFGKITNIAGSVITVDAWEGEPGSISASPAGGNDFAYQISGSRAELGTGIPGQAATSLTLTDIVSSVETGYTVSVQSDGNLVNAGGQFITNVTDGAVSLGSEEYGGEAIGSFATSTGSDFAFPSGTPLDVQESSTAGANDRSAVIYKMTVTGGTPSGNYTQNLFYRLTPNY